MTARRRAGETGTALRRGFAPVAPTPADEPAPAAVTSVPAAALVRKGSKYTAVLDDQTAAAFDELALRARRVLGRRVEKVEIMRVLIMLAADDASLRDQVIAEVEARRG